MTQQRRPFVVVIVLALFFLAGLVTVLLGSGPAPDGAITPASNQGETVLILGVDNLSAPQPRLVAVWMATYSPENRDLILLGQPIDRLICNSPPANLQQLFGWDPGSGLSLAFLAAFKPSPPDAYVIADETAFATLIDELQGLELDGARLEGDQVVAVLRTLYDKPAGLLSTQEQFLIALSRRAVQTSSQVDLTKLTNLIPGHAYTSVPPQDLLTLYLRLQPLGSSSILVYAPQLEPPACEG